ncbi:uncharacterized protein MONBRDRAFT_31892 [Monosiga brevicollis MX1]|uniref:Fibrillar collagen NC1 domain-containing protein n=1 Tax=Monosiga brevicollis TaxID=81824 RepID=A9UW31_MONBE|nr:uncharacterized protein MONBRDRAFT_31892 [Monosiga brevicollis MX1]EDQ90696.1 predicted protein [Monosiga brevicollis MX1]|eukprot:XP_001744747.1 hypothetical protein [Monosiga brevicollis MX1]
MALPWLRRGAVLLLLLTTVWSGLGAEPSMEVTEGTIVMEATDVEFVVLDGNYRTSVVQMRNALQANISSLAGTIADTNQQLNISLQATIRELDELFTNSLNVTADTISTNLLQEIDEAITHSQLVLSQLNELRAQTQSNISALAEAAATARSVLRTETQANFSALAETEMHARNQLREEAHANLTALQSSNQEVTDQLEADLTVVTETTLPALSARVDEVAHNLSTILVRDGSSRGAAAASCQAIFNVNLGLTNGTYWLDPNGQSTHDAVQLKCERVDNTVYTVLPAPPALPMGGHFSADASADRWESVRSINDTVFQYGDIPDDQLRALLARSSSGRQSIQLDCRGVISSLWDDVDWYYEYPVVLVGLSGEVWTFPTADDLGFQGRVFRPNIVFDNCSQNHVDELGLSIYDMEGPATALPIVDMWLSDIGNANESFGFSLSEVRLSEAFQGPVVAYGTRMRPGKSCLDIFMHGYGSNDTYYYIDPNGGLRNDSVRVFCNMTGGGWTGIAPLEQVPFKAWNPSGTDGYRFFSLHTGGYEITYDMADHQLDLLLASSSEAFQVLTVACQDALVYYYDSSNLYSYAFRYKGYNDVLWTYESDGLNVPVDNCKANDATTRSTVVEFTGTPGDLPIRDFAPRDMGGATEFIGVHFSFVWAVKFDKEARYDLALNNYRVALELLVPCIAPQSTLPVDMRGNLQQRIRDYMSRAEIVKEAARKERLCADQAAKAHSAEVLHIKQNDVGYDYQTLFGKYFTGAQVVTVEDPYLYRPHQIINLVHFFEAALAGIGRDNFKMAVVRTKHQQDGVNQAEVFAGLESNLQEYGVRLVVEYEDFHDRCVRFDNGYIIGLGAGLDIYLRPERQFQLGMHDYRLRKCRETRIVASYNSREDRRT